MFMHRVFSVALAGIAIAGPVWATDDLTSELTQSMTSPSKPTAIVTASDCDPGVDAACASAASGIVEMSDDTVIKPIPADVDE